MMKRPSLHSLLRRSEIEMLLLMLKIPKFLKGKTIKINGFMGENVYATIGDYEKKYGGLNVNYGNIALIDFFSEWKSGKIEFIKKNS